MRVLRGLWWLHFSVLIAVAVASESLYAENKGVDGLLTALSADDLKIVQKGEVVYHAQCASCHGKYLQESPDWRVRDKNGYLPAPHHDETGHTWHHADDMRFEITKFGPMAVIGDPGYKTLMPAYQYRLSDDDIIAVLSFIKNAWPAQQRKWQEQVNGNTLGAGSASSGSKPGLMERLLGN